MRTQNKSRAFMYYFCSVCQWLSTNAKSLEQIYMLFSLVPLIFACSCPCSLYVIHFYLTLHTNSRVRKRIILISKCQFLLLEKKKKTKQKTVLSYLAQSKEAAAYSSKVHAATVKLGWSRSLNVHWRHMLLFSVTPVQHLDQFNTFRHCE